MAAKPPAVAYLRTSSATNLGGDSDARQRLAVGAYARAAGLAIAREFYDQAVSGADSLDARPGFTAMLAWAAENDVRTIVVEAAHRFARDLIVQETGHALLKAQGFTLIAADDPDAFTADTPTARLVRQILGAVSEFEKAALVAKLKGARDRRSVSLGRRCEGRRSHVEARPELQREARRLARANPKSGARRSLRVIAAELAELGFVAGSGRPYSATQVKRILAAVPRTAAGHGARQRQGRPSGAASGGAAQP